MASPSIDEPKRGVSGQNLQLAVNYIPIQQQTGGVYQYAVAFAPEVESRGIRSAMVNEHTDVIGKVKAFDGCQLFLPIRLPQVKTEFTSKRLTDGVLITITVTLVKVLEADQCVQLYNIIFRRVMRHLKMQQVGRNYFDATRPIKIPQHKLELWPGYVTAIQHYEGGLLLVTDVSHRTLRTDTVLDVMYEMYQKYPKNFQEEVARHLIGRVVLTRYNNRTYRIDDIAWDLNPQCTFQCHDGSEVRFMDYYKKQYNLSIGDTEQPLLVNKPKPKLKPRGKHDPPKAVAESQKICLIPELSCMTGLTDDTRADFRAMKDIASHTRLTPADRISALRKFIENINSCKEAKAELENWGIKIHPDVLKVTGRQLQGEKILLKSRNFICGHEADWSREIMKEHMITAVPLQNWILGFTKKDQKNAMEFVKMLQQVGPPMGMPIKEPMLLEMKDDRIETFVRSIRDNCTPEVQLVVVVQPTSRDDRYAAIKKLCCVEKPVPSQVINGRTITQPQKLKAITQKIALQINCKLGGELWALEIPLKNMMVVGIDVYHETSHKGRSVGGFVASVNSSLTRWYSRVCFQMTGQELVDRLRGCFQAALRMYLQVNGRLPDRVVVFRDGVGNGQMSMVRDYEVTQLQECFQEFSADYQPKLSVVIVQKRVNTRLLAIGVLILYC
jgi:aubergine-like protein